MQNSRYGAAANQSQSEINLDKPVFCWDVGAHQVTIKRDEVEDFSTLFRHTHTIALSGEKMKEILKRIINS